MTPRTVLFVLLCGVPAVAFGQSEAQAIEAYPDPPEVEIAAPRVEAPPAEVEAAQAPEAERVSEASGDAGGSTASSGAPSAATSAATLTPAPRGAPATAVAGPMYPALRPNRPMQVGLGLLGALAGGIGGLLLVNAIACANGSYYCELTGVFVGLPIGALLGLSTGVWGGGYASTGQPGGYFHTLVGTVLGAIAGALLLVVPVIGWVAAPIVVMMGALWGYDWSLPKASPPPVTRGRPRSPGWMLQVAPVVTRSGSGFGLHATF